MTNNIAKTEATALDLIADAKARYIKQKVKAKSRKLTKERNALLNSPKYEVLNDFRYREDINTAFGFALITSREQERLLDLWDEREEIIEHIDANGFFGDDVTEALGNAIDYLKEYFKQERIKESTMQQLGL